MAGKTGTTNDNRDLWFVGYLTGGDLLTGIWLGNDDNYPTGGSSTTAAYTWKEFMEEVVPTLPVEKFPELPKLDGRKGIIKAQPVKPNSMYNVSAAEAGEATEAETASSSEADGYYDDSSYYEESN